MVQLVGPTRPTLCCQERMHGDHGMMEEDADQEHQNRGRSLVSEYHEVVVKDTAAANMLSLMLSWRAGVLVAYIIAAAVTSNTSTAQQIFSSSWPIIVSSFQQQSAWHDRTGAGIDEALTTRRTSYREHKQEVDRCHVLDASEKFIFNLLVLLPVAALFIGTPAPKRGRPRKGNEEEDVRGWVNDRTVPDVNERRRGGKDTTRRSKQESGSEWRVNGHADESCQQCWYENAHLARAPRTSAVIVAGLTLLFLSSLALFSECRAAMNDGTTPPRPGNPPIQQGPQQDIIAFFLFLHNKERQRQRRNPTKRRPNQLVPYQTSTSTPDHVGCS